MKLKTEVFEKAIRQLEQTMRYCEKETDAIKKNMLRTASIQCFEYTYELAVKMLKRQLREMMASAEVEELTFKDFIRTGAEKGLIDEPTEWFGFKEKRNLTAHTYNETTAEDIYAVLGNFFKKAQFLLAQIKKHNR
ncbi:MAG: HI0074 family nucleotidyltransferase substrate-binding subunit [Verrucomicrobiota bacterium]